MVRPEAVGGQPFGGRWVPISYISGAMPLQGANRDGRAKPLTRILCPTVGPPAGEAACGLTEAPVPVTILPLQGRFPGGRGRWGKECAMTKTLASHRLPHASPGETASHGAERRRAPRCGRQGRQGANLRARRAADTGTRSPAGAC
ncbi:hypothetical protein caldi_10570 [Caldinitratiruptor microaerophilus]|uniref:Uncharacterized protein n=1 Tax=Caldinitratiruptor microaerophilus TaxID=671077 RepID=A0AA35CLX5_9FIRM|nr:hypothetical protein caldi_10570 [Caldinitratiruptor microaerophilus]